MQIIEQPETLRSKLEVAQSLLAERTRIQQLQSAAERDQRTANAEFQASMDSLGPVRQ